MTELQAWLFVFALVGLLAVCVLKRGW